MVLYVGVGVNATTSVWRGTTSAARWISDRWCPVRPVRAYFLMTSVLYIIPYIIYGHYFCLSVSHRQAPFLPCGQTHGSPTFSIINKPDNIPMFMSCMLAMLVPKQTPLPQDPSFITNTLSLSGAVIDWIVMTGGWNRQLNAPMACCNQTSEYKQK